MHNPSLRKIPVHEPADVIPSKQQVSLLDWLTATGRLMARDNQESQEFPNEEQEISDLIVDDGPYEDDDDSDDSDDSIE